MSINRRTALLRLAALAGAWPVARSTQPDSARVRKIATEEAFTIPEMVQPVREVLQRGGPSLDLVLLNSIYGAPASNAAAASNQSSTNRDALARQLLPTLLDIDKARIADMDANNVDMHVLSLSMPGVQIFERDAAVALARVANDRLGDAVLPAQYLHHDQRRRGPSCATLLYRETWRRADHVGDRLSVSADCAGSRIH